MTYVITEPCIKCTYSDCVEVCPVNCFYEGENFLVIHPDECIDCSAADGGKNPGRGSNLGPRGDLRLLSFWPRSAGSPYLRQHAENPIDWYSWCKSCASHTRRPGRLATWRLPDAPQTSSQTR